MELKEALGKITDPEVRAFFEKMVSDQNSYITKLQNQLKEQQKPAAAAGSDDVTRKYILEKMKEDVMKQATAVIVNAIGQDKFNAVKPDFDKFLVNLTPEHTNVDYVIDAFNLVYGRCLTNPNHPIHQVGKAVNPSGTPAPQVAGTNGQQVEVVQNIMAGQPQPMTSNDANAGQGIPGTQGEPVKNTNEAFKNLKNRLQGVGSNRFQ
jgi:hypothetical protein